MALLSKIKHETGIKNFEDISPESVLCMLHEVRVDLGKLDSSFTDVGLARVLEVVKTGEYKINGTISTNIDLSDAKSVIEAYRRYSEGGCQSCVDFERNVLNDDMECFFYCGRKEHYIETPKKCGYGRGHSPEVNKHYENPCEEHRPKFSPIIEKLITRGE